FCSLKYFEVSEPLWIFFDPFAFGFIFLDLRDKLFALRAIPLFSSHKGLDKDLRDLLRIFLAFPPSET
ncbi:hypothetical protein, partial [Helicobacter kayseriensis]|uniref:hypothetical protein n=1 Tax=Helicobacter kayseriensis TaxID=2905877 RepID=UPI001E625827